MASDFFDAVFFDMDGLTINSEPQWLEAELTAPYGYNWTTEDQAACLGGPLWCNGAQDGSYFHNAIVQLMANKVRQFADFMPGAKSLLSQLHEAEIPLALVSVGASILAMFNQFLFV